MPLAALPSSVVHRLVLAKHLLLDGRRLTTLSQDKFGFARGLLCLHDGAELVLATIADHVSAPRRTHSTLLDYPGAIVGKVPTGPGIANSHELDTLNRVRNQIKHGGLLPDRASLAGLADLVWELCVRACADYMGVAFEGLWLGEAVVDLTVKHWLSKADEHIRRGEWEQTLISLGYAIYHLVEVRAQTYPDLFPSPLAPPRRARWHKTSPHSTDYQVVLLGYGVDPRHYQRFRSLTPTMGRNQDSDVLYEWDKWDGHEGNWTEANARWCLEFCTDCALRIQALQPDFPPLVHYGELFIDEIRSRGTSAEFFNFPAEEQPTAFNALLSPRPERQRVYTLGTTECLTGFVFNEDDGELMIVGLRDPSGERINNGHAYVAAGSVTWQRVNRAATTE